MSYDVTVRNLQIYVPPISNFHLPSLQISFMATHYFQLHLSPLKQQCFPHLPRFMLTPRVRQTVFSSAIHSAVTVNGPLDNDVINGSPPVYHEEEDPGRLSTGLGKELVPNHVAVIMDGNRRWARMRGLPTGSGHEAGARALRRVIELCCKWRIKVFTVFAFSSENWCRPKLETDLLMGLFEKVLRDELQHFVREKIRISVIGDSTKLPKQLQMLLSDAVEATKNNTRLHLIVAVNYSGQNDIVQACQKIALRVKDGLIEPEEINKRLVELELETNCTDYPNPDLLIRTSGELRISNFLLWQLAYTELYFANSLWPDFGEDEFVKALSSFQQRQRHYGGGRSY